MSHAKGWFFDFRVAFGRPCLFFGGQFTRSFIQLSASLC